MSGPSDRLPAPGPRPGPWAIHRRRRLRLLAGLRRGAGRLGQALTGRWLASLAGALAASLLLWSLAPLLDLDGVHPFEAQEPRLGGVLGIMVAWGLFHQLRQTREHRADRRLIRALTVAAGGELPLALPPPRRHRPAAAAAATATAGGASPLRLSAALREMPVPPAAPPAGEVEIAGLSRRLAEGLATYGRRLGTPSLRRLPWYLVIGAPGAGKTTAVAQSGLTFPLSDILGHRPIQGVAGTRTCDWWFTTEAVLVDTAGRYTTQDSEPAGDSAAWLGLLDLLRRHRPSQPVNGLLVAVSLGDVARQNEVERHVTAESLNRRLAEIDAHLDNPVPVYVLLTKADQLAGFSEVFATLAPEQCRQVWGMTFDLADGDGPATAPTLSNLFNRQYERLLGRLEPLVLDRLHEEPDPVRRGLIAGFPHQMAAMRPVLAEFLTQALRPPSGDPRLRLRGIYLSSAKREGRPTDRLAAEITSTFGLDHRLPVIDGGPGDALFLTRLFREVIFAEAHLAGRDAGRNRGRLASGARLAIPAVLGTTLVLAGLWAGTWLSNHRLLERFSDDLARAASLMPDELGGASRQDRVGDGDLAAVLPALDALRAVRATVAAHGAGQAWSIGLDQGEQLARLADGLYQRGLRRLMAPRLVIALEQAMVAPAGDPPSPDRLYDALRVYLMVTGQAPLDHYAVTQWFALDWIAALPGPDQEADRRRLSDHLTALLDAGLPSATASEPVVAEVRRRLADYRPAERGYALVREVPAVRQLPGWHLLEHAGAAINAVLMRNSGRSLQEPVAGLYTAEGAVQAVLPAIAKVAGELAREGWVLGLPGTDEAVAGRGRHLRQDIAARYFEDYTRQWLGVIADLAVAPTGGLADALAQLAAATGPNTPLPALIAAIAAETAPQPPQLQPQPPPAAMPGQPMVLAQVHPVPGDAEAGWWTPMTADLSRRFAPLQTLGHPGSAAAQTALGAALASLGELHTALARWSGTGSAADEAEIRRIADRVKTQAAALPAPVAGWITSLGDAGSRPLLLGQGAPR